MNVWIYDNDYARELYADAKRLYKSYPDYSLEIHWCLLLAAYPVFGDVCRLIGKMSEFQDEITLAQLKQKVFDEWGERTTLFHSIDKLVATLKALGVLTCDKPGKYKVQKFEVKNSKVVCFMAHTLMCVDDSAYHTVESLNNAAIFFPFSYTVDKTDLMDDGNFIFSNFGGEATVSLKEN